MKSKFLTDRYLKLYSTQDDLNVKLDIYCAIPGWRKKGEWNRKSRAYYESPTWRLVQSVSQFNQPNEVKMLSVINFPSNFFRHKQTIPHSGYSVNWRIRFPWTCLLFFENRPGSKTFGSMMIRDDIMGPLQWTNEAMYHYSVAKG